MGLSRLAWQLAAVGVTSTFAYSIGCSASPRQLAPSPEPPMPPIESEPTTSAPEPEERPPEQTAARPPITDWQITYETDSGTDWGDGVIRDTSESSRTVLPGDLEPERAAKISALVPRLEGLSGTYRWSKYVNDEGWQHEAITVTYGDQRLSFGYEQGREVELPPEPVARLYELVTGTALPSTAEQAK